MQNEQLMTKMMRITAWVVKTRWTFHVAMPEEIGLRYLWKTRSEAAKWHAVYIYSC